jgi:FtsP/CotA-like multicopper oxidase with cupredoxin domain
MPIPFRSPAALLLVAALAAATPASTQSVPPGGACAFQPIDARTWGMQPFRNPPEVRAREGQLRTTLDVRYSDPAVTSIAGCPVTLRTYNGQLVGPTLRAKPGDVLNVLLANNLPVETPDRVQAQFVQQDTSAFIGTRPHPYNTTNLHTHGLHVSPVGNSDNVLLAIPAQTRFPYEIRLPADHTRGTYWYHAHAHGSTAIQVGSGMAGALIVEDDPAAIPRALREANAREKVFVLQTLLYDTLGRADHIAAFFPDNDRTKALCEQGNPECTWQHSHRRVTVNGQIVPVIRMRRGEVQRWRFVDAGFREEFRIQLEGHPLHEIATDGIYTGRIDTWSPDQFLDLQPGYRSDVLVQASMTPGTYRLRDLPSAAAEGLRGVAEDENLVALVIVEPGAPLRMALPTAAEMAALDPWPGLVLRDSADGVQEAVFKLGSAVHPLRDARNSFQINYAAFNPTRIRYLQLGATEQWTLTTVGDPAGIDPDSLAIPPLPHVFHIHVNPFQIQRPGPDGTPQWVWKDSQVINPGETVTLYTRYLDYIGQFVIHCHILDHEDLGMMEVIEIVGEVPSGAMPGHGAHH